MHYMARSNFEWAYCGSIENCLSSAFGDFFGDRSYVWVIVCTVGGSETCHVFIKLCKAIT